MDGASKFVRGDAVAGIIITFINIVLGGFYVGMVEHGWDILPTAKLYTQADHRRRPGQPDSRLRHLAGRGPDRHANQQPQGSGRRNAQSGLSPSREH